MHACLRRWKESFFNTTRHVTGQGGFVNRFGMSEICQKDLPEEMHVMRALPGIQPLEMSDWLRVDDAYGAQMCERIRLMGAQRDDVRAAIDSSEPAIDEAFEAIVAQVQTLEGFTRVGDHMLCPDGRSVDLNGEPLIVIGHLIQEDICILERPDGLDEHILSAAILCFPAHWTLSEKIGKPMGRIHQPVDEYDENIRRRVQRLFDGVQVGRPLWRFNRAYSGATLYQPRLEKDYSEYDPSAVNDFLRSERQVLVRLPNSKAVIFSIHTYVIDQREIGESS